MTNAERSYSVSDVLFLIFAIVGTGFNLLLAIGTAGLSLLSAAMGTDDLGPQATSWAITFGFFALVGFPAIYFGARKLSDRDSIPHQLPKWLTILVLFMFPVALLFGYVGFSQGIFSGILGTLAHISAATGAAAFAILLVRKYAPPLTRRRLWGQFSLGLWVVPYLAIAGELLLTIPMIAFFAVGALGSEQGRRLLDLLADPSYSSNPMLTDAANELLAEPWVILLIFAFVSVLVPLLEEALKTMVIWPLVRRNPSASEAFVGGVIGGAAYALVEAVLLSQQADAWLATMTARTGATLMHAFTTGIACWGLAEGFSKKRWGRSIAGYLIAVLFHGLWNALAISVALIEGSMAEMEVVPDATVVLQVIITLTILLLVATALIGLPRIAKRLARQPTNPSESDLAELASQT